MNRTRVWLATIAAGSALIIGPSLYFWGDNLLPALGRLLLYTEMPRHADILVVVRGDETKFERALTVAGLFQAGNADRVYVSSALNDTDAENLVRHGLSLPTPQRNIASVLMGKGVPCEKISLDGSAPGGGTLGEAWRLANFMSKQNLHSAIAVTSWYHTGRLKRILNDIFTRSGRSASVVAADSDAGPQNWWKHRYLAIIVLEEFFKSFLQFGGGTLGFLDDSPATVADGGAGQVSTACGL